MEQIGVPMTYMKTSLLILMSLTLISCGKETDADKIADAQACLDKATAANASACVAKVEGINSKGANLIRCVGTFVKQNLGTPSALAQIFTALDDNGGGGRNATIGIMDAITFKTNSGSAIPNSQDLSDSQYAASICNESNSPGLGMLSTLTVTATTVSSIGLGSINNTTLENCATDDCSPQQLAAIGSAVQLAYQSNCMNGGSSLGDVCTQLDSVIQNAGGSNTAIADTLLRCLAGTLPPATCQGF
jgi:hypothetical protein